MGFTGFYWILPGFTEFYWVLLGFTGFYWVLSGSTGFYRVLPDFILLLPVFNGFSRSAGRCSAEAHSFSSASDGGGRTAREEADGSEQNKSQTKRKRKQPTPLRDAADR